MTARLILPLPPSINRSHRNVTVQKRIRTPETVTYMREAGWLAKSWAQQSHWCIPPPQQKVVMRVWYWWPNARRQDTHRSIWMGFQGRRCGVMKYIAWSEEEIEYLKANHKTKNHTEIAVVLNRTARAVRNKCHYLGFRKLNPEWTQDEDDLLRELYGRYSERGFLDSVAKEFGRTRYAVCIRAAKLGLTQRDRTPLRSTTLACMNSPRRFEGTRNGLGASTHGGKRADLGIYVRSTWEANYARYLNWLCERGEISKWEYEAEEFEFEKIKRGTRYYLPDFKVTNKDGTLEYHEVKGYMTAQARTALNRMARYFPEVRIILIDGPIYKDIRNKIGRLIPHWEDPPHQSRDIIWTKEKEKILADMWSRGVHASKIASELGLSRNAIAVRAHRIGAMRPKNRKGWHP